MALEGKIPVYQLQVADNLQEGKVSPIRLLNTDGSAIESIGGANVVLELDFSGTSDPSVTVIRNDTESDVVSARTSAGVYALSFDAGALGPTPLVVASFVNTQTGTILRENVTTSTGLVILRNYNSSFTETDLPFFSRVVVSIWIY